MRNLWMCCCCVIVLMAAGTALGHDVEEDAGRRDAGRADSRQLLEEILMARLARELALDETQTVLLVRHLTEHRDRIIALRRQRAEKMRELRQAVREGADEARIQGLLDEVVALTEKNANGRMQILEFDAFEMTVWQKARLLVFLNDFESDMRQLLRRVRERNDARRPGGGESRPAPESQGEDAPEEPGSREERTSDAAPGG